MALQKPSWLETVLSWLNWDILAWKVYVGDAIENAIDWVISWINLALDWAVEALNNIAAWWDRLLDWWSSWWSVISSWFTEIWNSIAAWWDQLGDWWDTRVTIVQGWIGAAGDVLRDMVQNVRSYVDGLWAQWDNFRLSVLPRLLDFSWVTSFFGGAFGTISDWWSPKQQGIRDELEAEVKPVRDEVNKHTSIFTLFNLFFTDPVKFLYVIIDDLIERFW